MLNILVTGCRGRMGQAVTAVASEDSDTRVAAGIDLGDSLEEALAKSDIVIDFTLPSFTNELIEEAVKAGKGIVMGTTGHDDSQLELIKEASTSVPIVHAPNYSVGVNTLFWLTQKATEVLGSDFDLEVVEMHHRHKKGRAAHPQDEPPSAGRVRAAAR
ncbi:MAG: hypothetical protein AAF357_15220 [Verrucomicrobiota bacterium]